MVHSSVVPFPANKYHSQHCSIMGCEKPACCLIRLGQLYSFLLLESFNLIVSTGIVPCSFIPSSTTNHPQHRNIIALWEFCCYFIRCGRLCALSRHCVNLCGSLSSIFRTRNTPGRQYHGLWGARMLFDSRRKTLFRRSFCRLLILTTLSQPGWSLVQPYLHRPTNCKYL